MERSKEAPSGRRHYNAAQLKVIFYLAWKNLTSKKLRSALTIMGVVIGIGAISFLLSFGLGLQYLVTQEVVGSESIKAIEVTSPNSKIIKLDEPTVNRLRQMGHVDKVGTQFSFPGSLRFNGSEVDAVVYGIDEEYQELSRLQKIEGRLLKEDDKNSIVINKAGLTTIGINEPKQAIGKKLKMTIPLDKYQARIAKVEDDFTIVGVIDSGSGTEVFMPGHIFSTGGIQTYQQVKLLADDVEAVDLVRKHIEGSGFETISPIDTLEQINQVFRFFNLILVAFGSIGLIVSVLGMFNTLTISLLERTKEIGLMMAMGARNSDMRKLFIFEAVLISFIGAIIGIGASMIQGQVVNIVLSKFAQGRGVEESIDVFSTPFWLIGLLTLFTVTVGLLVVYFPARRAQHINPIDALRRE